MTTLVMRPITTITKEEAGIIDGQWPVELKHEGFTWTRPVIIRIKEELVHVVYQCGMRKLVITV